MTKKWEPTTGDFLCPGKMMITADEIGITIGRGRRALATSEWPGSNIRLCELVEEPDTSPSVPEDVQEAIIDALYTQRVDIRIAAERYPKQTVEAVLEGINAALAWIESLKKESRK